MYYYDSYLKTYLETLKLEGYSEATIRVYKNVLAKMFSVIDKDIKEVSVSDIRNYLADYKRERNISNVTLNNYQHYIKAYFKWLYQEEYIDKNPCENLHSIKAPKLLKDGFSHAEMVKLREACHTPRERALVEFLYSSGVRASELVSLDLKDINWERNKTRVFGKGQKEREVYFTSSAADALKEYLDKRVDDNPALFVSAHAPSVRIAVGSLEATLKTIGERCGLHVYPHRFRHTCASILLENGMPIQEVGEILGHSRVDTTMIYCTLNKDKIANDYINCIE